MHRALVRTDSVRLVWRCERRRVMTKYESHGGKESARKQQERIRFYESKVKEMDADRRKKGESKARKQVEK